MITTFKTLKELINYCPNCVLCQKPMQLYISLYSKELRDNFKLKKLKTIIALDIKNDILKSRNDNYKIEINLNSNEIISCHPMIKILNSHLHKKCKTCKFELDYELDQVKNKSINDITLYFERLDISLKKSHNFIYYHGRSFKDNYYFMWIINGKRICIYYALDFSKITNKKQLFTKIETILTFT